MMSERRDIPPTDGKGGSIPCTLKGVFLLDIGTYLKLVFIGNY